MTLYQCKEEQKKVVLNFQKINIEILIGENKMRMNNLCDRQNGIKNVQMKS